MALCRLCIRRDVDVVSMENALRSKRWAPLLQATQPQSSAPCVCVYICFTNKYLHVNPDTKSTRMWYILLNEEKYFRK